MKKLFLNDVRQPPDDSWVVVRNYKEFAAYIEAHGVPDIISFDHDRGYFPNIEDGPYRSGYDCAKWLIERGHLPKKFILKIRTVQTFLLW